jgi:2-haloacid dehalogenase/putative hydrolase of the HAD superfamily
MYGTLTAGDRAAVERVCQDVIAAVGLDLSPRALGVAWGERFFQALDHANDAEFTTLFEVEARTLRATLADCGIAIDPYPYVRQLTAYWRAAPLQPEAAEFFTSFPLPICIVSNADRADLLACLARYGLQPAEVVTSEDVRSYKPAPLIFAEALQRTGWRPERVIHVGDSLHSDVGGARAAGLRSGWLNRTHRIHDIGRDQPDYEFADLHALTALVQGLPSA